ncbi:primase C-terminal domain-containing protein [Leptolyngbya sp. FACHB-671]|uniref:primase C-terminal domain-containing protein n=1 Tax=Leptolyngbya sp. FACHB-671 TaxID=2692812 RepID=UPI001683B24D|nr:primase C-terminal domain-containing protein [Leptolyngbya sp. FACHB-671]MBD2066034.1 primase C-terminal domain-containing protein [Leptolyngbya sp. FACHB-671]
MRTPPPHDWPLKKDGSPVNHVYTGTVNKTGFSLTLCEYVGRDENSNSIWQPTGQHYSDGFTHCLDLSHAGATIYFYPNQPQGGISNAHVTGTDLVFYEIDDLPLAQQQEALNRFCTLTGLEPTAVVFTGGKSLHVYFRLTENVSPSEWQRQNRKLTIIQNSDPALCNPARAMRVPGLVRRKVVDGKLTEPVQITLERFSDAAYTPADFEASLNSTGLFPHGLSDERWRQWQRAKRDGQDTSAILQKPESDLVPKWVPAVRTLINDGSAVPLEKLLSKDDQALYNNGAGEGNRDNAGYKFARNVFATHARALELGIRIIGDPLQYIEEYGSRCTPPLPERDIDRIYRSATRGNPSPTFSDEILLACAAAYQHRQNTSILSKPPGEISRAEWESRHKLQQDTKKLANFLTGKLKALLRKSNRFSSSVFAGPKTLPPIAQPEIAGGLLPYGVRLDAAGKRTFRYEKGNLPTLDRWIWLGRPRILCTFDLAQVMVAEGLEKGWKHFHDRSGTGSGKSYLWGDINLGHFPSIDQVIMTTGNPENPTTAPTEKNYARLPARHKGLVYEHTHKTPSGRLHRRRAKTGENPDIPGNCPETDTFRKFDERGVIMRGGKGSAVCESCQLFGSSCEFIPARQLTLKDETCIICHINQVPEKFPEGWNVLGVHDEPGQTLKTTRTIRFPWEGLRRGLEKIRSLDPGLHSYLFPIFIAWQTAIPAKIHQRFGLNFIELVESLPVPRFIAGDGQTRDFLEAGKQADKLLNPQFSLSGIQTPSQKQSWIDENIHPHYFTLLFEALTDTDKRSCVTLDHNWNFTVTRRNYHYPRVAEAMAGNVWLDATLSTGDLAMKIGAKTNDFLPYEMVAEDAPADGKPYENLTLKVVNRIGKCGRNREAGSQYTQTERLAKLGETIEQQIFQANPTASKPAVIDFKVHATEGQGYWHKDSRGSNAYQDADHLILKGLPVPNLGAMAAEYQALTGNAVRPDDLTGSKGDWVHPSRLITPKTRTGHSISYGRWVDRQVVAEVIQAIGRLRANRTDKAKTCWLISDDYDASVVAKLQRAFPGCTVEVMAASDICVEAAPKGEQTKLAVIEAGWHLLKAGKAVTTGAVAKLADISRSRVSQIVSSNGGFSQLQGVLETLYSFYIGKLTPSELSKDARFVAQTWLPDIAAQIAAGEEVDVIAELAYIRDGFGTRTYMAILASTPIRAIGKLFEWALLRLPPAILRDIGEAEPILA